jgi:hypothetical protein
VRLLRLADATAVDARGRRTPSTMLQLDERDHFLREAARFFPFFSQREVARRLRTALLRYQTGRWRRTRTEFTCPEHRDRLEAVLWSLLKTRDYVPSERLIRAVLSQAEVDRGFA